MIDPCLPEELGKVEVTRLFRGKRYEIEIENRAGGEKGNVTVYVNDRKIEGQTITAADADTDVVRVRAVVD